VICITDLLVWTNIFEKNIRDIKQSSPTTRFVCLGKCWYLWNNLHSSRYVYARIFEKEISKFFSRLLFCTQTSLAAPPYDICRTHYFKIYVYHSILNVKQQNTNVNVNVTDLSTR